MLNCKSFSLEIINLKGKIIIITFNFKENYYFLLIVNKRHKNKFINNNFGFLKNLWIM